LLQNADTLGKLSSLENASNGVYPQLNASANLKQLRINLDSKLGAKFKPTVALKIPRTTLSISGNGMAGESQGTYQNPTNSSMCVSLASTDFYPTILTRTSSCRC